MAVTIVERLRMTRQILMGMELGMHVTTVLARVMLLKLILTKMALAMLVMSSGEQIRMSM